MRLNEYETLMAKAADALAAEQSKTRDLLEALKGLTDAYCALLLMKSEDPSRFKEPGSPYAKADAAIARAEGKE